MNDFLTTMQSFYEKLLQQQQANNIDQPPLQEMSLKEIEDLKQHYLDEMLSLSNDLGIKDYQNEKIDIRFRRECKDTIHELKGKFNGMSIEINKRREHHSQSGWLILSAISLNETISQESPSIANTPVSPTLEAEDSLIMGNKELNTIPEKESDEFIKSSVEDLVPIPSESEDTSESASECILPSCNDFSPIVIPEEKSVTFSNPLFNSNDDFTSSDDKSISDEDVLEDNVKIYSNPHFEFDNEYISSDLNPLFNEVLEDIECKDSYDSNIDESTFLVTSLFDVNEDECFDSGGDVDKINEFKNGYYDSEGDILYLESLLNDDLVHHDPSIPAMSVASILEGFTDEPPLEENDDLFDLESKNDECNKILYDA
nr:hypothetical protein [Tanacetum cinerariifolium]